MKPPRSTVLFDISTDDLFHMSLGPTGALNIILPLYDLLFVTTFLRTLSDGSNESPRSEAVLDWPSSVPFDERPLSLKSELRVPGRFS
jgi:hypothetical protein